MRVLLNATTLKVGGGFYIGLNFIQETLKSTQCDIEWYYLLPRVLYDELLKLKISVPIDKLWIVHQSPAKLWGRRSITKKIKLAEKKCNPDIVYSIGSPSYVKFKSIEVQRLTNPYITHLNDYALKTHDIGNRIILKFNIYLQRLIVARGKYFITQTNTSKKGILKLTGGQPEDIAVIPNSLSEVYQKCSLKNDPVEENYIFCFAAPHPHKNIQKIPMVARMIADKKVGINFKFVVTIPIDNPLIDSFNEKCVHYNIQDHIINIGKINQDESVKWYLNSKMFFFPTYLETYSASILEALFLKTPILTTNFEFNREVAEKYALYFEPEDWDNASDLIIQLLECKKLRKKIQMPDNELIENIKTFSQTYQDTIVFLKKVSSLN